MRTHLLLLVSWVAVLAGGCSAPDRVDPVERPARVAVLRLGPADGQSASRVLIGTHFTAQDLQDAADALAADQPDVVLISIACHSQVDSPLDVAEFIDLLEERPFGTARVVAYIRDGLGAPGVLAWGFPELLVHASGQVGYFSLAPPRFVTWHSNGHELFKLHCHEIIRTATSLSGRPAIVVRAMCGTQNLYGRGAPGSDGIVWSDSPGYGSQLVCKSGQLLILQAGDLVRFSLATGIAADEEDAISQLTQRGAERVGHAASTLLANRIARAVEADEAIQAQLIEYHTLVQRLARTSPPTLAADDERRLVAALTALRSTLIKNPRLAKYHGTGTDWLDDQGCLLKRLWNIDPLVHPE